MLLTCEGAICVAREPGSFVDDKTGEVKSFYRGTFVQDGSGPIEVTCVQDVYNEIEPLHKYSLEISLTSYQGKLRNRVTGVVEVE